MSFNFTKITPRILVVDDEPLMRQLLQDILVLANFEVMVAKSGQEALGIIANQGILHLAIVDINMPKMSGLELCEKIQAFIDLPVILVTAMDDEDTLVKGIEYYAEDYIIKPFRPRVLLARVRRILSRAYRSPQSFSRTIKIDAHLTIDFGKREANVAKKIISLTPIENKLLHVLVQNSNQIITTEFLLQRLWPLDEMFADTLRVHIHRLRHKIETTPNKPQYIVTERGVGYRFNKFD
ncbi:response regulator transcription factor [Anaerolineales bacterium HSG24]|nr:response regulator transcription factor [Anaerolineales bacterium HSG24]